MAGASVSQDRSGRFSTEVFERYQRSQKALVGTLAEMGACPRASEARPGGSGRFDEESEGGHRAASARRQAPAWAEL
jgi:hypothetical protein